jgi:hypothetical protein
MAFPFIYFFSKLLLFEKTGRELISIGLFVLMVSVSFAIYHGPLVRVVYPSIGQQVKLISDIPTITYSGEGAYYDIHPEFNDSGDATSTVLSGTLFVVSDIKVSNPDFGLSHGFILSNTNSAQKLIVNAAFLSASAYIDADEVEEKAFCKKAVWEFCDGIESRGADPMFFPFRLLTWLMVYPLLVMWPVMLISNIGYLIRT